MMMRIFLIILFVAVIHGGPAINKGNEKSHDHDHRAVTVKRPSEENKGNHGKNNEREFHKSHDTQSHGHGRKSLVESKAAKTHGKENNRDSHHSHISPKKPSMPQKSSLTTSRPAYVTQRPHSSKKDTTVRAAAFIDPNFTFCPEGQYKAVTGDCRTMFRKRRSNLQLIPETPPIVSEENNFEDPRKRHIKPQHVSSEGYNDKV